MLALSTNKLAAPRQQRLVSAPRPHGVGSKHRRNLARNVAETDSAQLSVATPKAKVLKLLKQGYSTYNPGNELGLAVEELIKSNPTADPGLTSTRIGQGVWEVFYAPHIANMSNILLTKYEPIRYVYQDDRFASHVKFQHPLLGEGWLSAAGALRVQDDTTLNVDFNQFWVDFGADKLRPFLSEAVDGGKVEAFGQEVRTEALFDTIAGALGRATFFPQLAVFPVLYVDMDLAVFKFPPLDSKIAIRRVGQAVAPSSSYWE